MCPLKRGVRLREVSAYRGSTVQVQYPLGLKPIERSADCAEEARCKKLMSQFLSLLEFGKLTFTSR